MTFTDTISAYVAEQRRNHPEARQEAWDEHEDEIIAARDSLAVNLRDALRAAASAERDLSRLHDLYDVEYVEGTQGEDIQAHLDTARRCLRAADALRYRED